MLTFQFPVFLPSHVVVDDDGMKPLKPPLLPSVPKMANCSQQIPKLTGDLRSMLHCTLKDWGQKRDFWPYWEKKALISYHHAMKSLTQHAGDPLWTKSDMVKYKGSEL